MSPELALEMRGAHGGRWKRYPAYKDSGVEWLGAVPEGWGVLPMKFIIRIRSGESPPQEKSKTDGDYPIHGANGVIGYCSHYNSTEKRILIGRVGAIGEVNIAPPKVWISDNVLVVGTNSAKLFFAFTLYLMKSVNLKIDATQNAQPLITASQVKNQIIVLPQIDEQRAIAAFLDRETAKIDALVAKKERLVKLLEEKRTALISHAVTKGLDPDAPMKDSGIEWLGEVPEGWEIRRNGALFTQRDERGFPDLPLLSVSLHTGTSVREFSSDRIEQMAEDRSTYKRAKKGDIVFNKMRMWQGAVGVAPTDGLVSTDYTVAKPLEGVQPRYFEHLFRTSFYKTETNRYSYGIVPDRNRLYWDRFKQMPSIYPPFNEQLEIVNRLDQLTEQTNRLSGSIREQMDKLKEYRTALISAAVTGKIDVRGEIP